MVQFFLFVLMTTIVMFLMQWMLTRNILKKKSLNDDPRAYSYAFYGWLLAEALSFGIVIPSIFAMDDYLAETTELGFLIRLPIIVVVGVAGQVVFMKIVFMMFPTLKQVASLVRPPSSASGGS